MNSLLKLSICASMFVVFLSWGARYITQSSRSTRLSNIPIVTVSDLEFPADLSARRTLRMEDLKLIGGWRVPPCVQPEWKSLAFTNGGLAVRNDADSIRFYMTHHNHLGGPIQELIAESIQGSPEVDVDSWPLLKPGRFLGDLYERARTHNKDFAAPTCTAVFWDDQAQRLLMSGRSLYAAPPPRGPFICSADISHPLSPTIEGPYQPANRLAQVFGGGFCDIPEWFADRYTNGYTLGIGFGGYCSGEGSTHGPSLAACPRELTHATPVVTLLQFGPLGTKDPSLREQRPPDYSNANSVWSIDPDGETGYWAGDAVIAGPVWIDTPNCHGLCYWSIQGCGKLEYSRQRETAGETTQERLYVYDPALLSKVAEGSIEPHSPKGHYEDWNCRTPGSVRGAYWDQKTQTLFLLYKFSYKNGEECFPAIAAYHVHQQPI